MALSAARCLFRGQGLQQGLDAGGGVPQLCLTQEHGAHLGGQMVEGGRVEALLFHQQQSGEIFFFHPDHGLPDPLPGQVKDQRHGKGHGTDHQQGQAQSQARVHASSPSCP